MDNASGPTAQDLALAIESLEERSVRDFLILAATKDQTLADRIRVQYESQLARERTRGTDFSHYSDDASYILEHKYSINSDGQEYELALVIAGEVEAICRAIVDRTHASSLFETKKNALDTLLSIGESIMLESSVLGRQVKKHIDQDCIVGNMENIVCTLSSEERYEMADEEDTFRDRLERLMDTADCEVMFEGLSEVLDLLHPPSDDYLEEGASFGDEEDGEDDDLELSVGKEYTTDAALMRSGVA